MRSGLCDLSLVTSNPLIGGICVCPFVPRWPEDTSERSRQITANWQIADHIWLRRLERSGIDYLGSDYSVHIRLITGVLVCLGAADAFIIFSLTPDGPLSWWVHCGRPQMTKCQRPELGGSHPLSDRGGRCAAFIRHGRIYPPKMSTWEDLTPSRMGGGSYSTLLEMGVRSAAFIRTGRISYPLG